MVEDNDGNMQNWSLPVTANVVMVLATASRLTGVCLKRLNQSVILLLGFRQLRMQQTMPC
jgi:hypothetical protein